MTHTASRPQQSWIGQTIGGRYKIEALLGHGGMSTVYQASDPNLRRTVAVKLIHPHLSNDPQFVRRFEQEAAAVAQLRHPNIIQVFDFAHDEGVYYMVLEHVPGETLQARLTALNAAHQRMPLAEIIQTMASICDAVAYAHQRNMIHRDLKPANVMISPQGQPILMDFGVAKMLGEVQHTATGAVVGTALYMSPEQARGDRPDERSDIYSLGVMLYEMITGVPPFKADSAVSLMMKHVTQPVPDIRQVNQTVPDLLVAVTKKALAKDPGERYRRASDMAVALRAIDTSGRAAVTLPVKSATDSTVYEPVGPAVLRESAVTLPRKNNLPLILGGLAVALILLVGVGIALFFIFRPTPAPADGEEQVIVGPEDTALPSSEKMIKIGAGTYSIGRDAPGQNYAPPQEVKLPEFWIDQYEVSNRQYAQFLADTKNQAPAAWSGGKFPTDQEDFPAQGISWDMANAYCQWIKKRLPSEAEWEVAARGPEGRLFPWGNDPKAVELPRSGVYKVGGKPTNQSAFGVFDMAGNVWEWVGDPYTPVQKEGDRVLRGGENGLLKDMAYRLEGLPSQESIIKTAGIRCAADKVEVAQQPQVAQVEGVLVQDNFADTGSGWPILSEGSYLYGYHPPDYYHVEVGQPNAHTVVARTQEFENATIETKVLVDHTDTEKGSFRYGLALRRNGDSYYAFTISPRTGTWQVVKSSPNKQDVLAEGGVQTLQGFAPQGFTPDKTDSLQVDANGSKFTFQINGQKVSEVNDSDYPDGEVGFYVETFDETLAHVHYDELTILELKGEAASPSPGKGILEQDDFTDTNTGWPVESNDKYVLGYHPPDYYHVQVGVPNDSVVVTHAPDFEDATVETEVLVDHTDTDAGNYRYGLALRRHGDDQFYAFVVSSRTGTWQVLKRTAAGLETLAEGKIETLRGFAPVGFTPDKSDILRVDAKGADFVFQVNGKPIAQVTDGDYKSGEVGFYVETFDESLAHVHYESLTVREVEFEAVAAVPVAATEPAEISTSDVVITPTVTVPPPTPSPEPTAEPTATAEPPPPTATAELPTPTVPPSPTTVRAPEGMVFVPAGAFLMGSSAGQANEAPEHEVSLTAFYLDIFEVSNAQYRACVADGVCTPGNKVDSFTYKGYRDDPTYNNYPVMGVTWDQAAAYCDWAGKRLPTEAEWEYAASGPENLTWPWGNTFNAQLAAASAGDIQPIDSYADGVSPFGVYNMAGNVGEWVADVYDEAFYANSPASNPISTGDGAGRIFRGGSFGNPDGAFFTTSRRYGNARTFNDVDVGLRCAQNAS